ncbi:MAG: substrate-binding domain-containing protein [Micrococcales bacterium]|nr:substrate-binding domain-containing protein [Micrococcales bacterium]
MTHRDDVARLEVEFAEAMQRMYSVGNGLARLRAGLEPGVDLGIVGFDGSETASMHHLTSVAQPFDAIAEESLRLVSSALVGDPAPDEGRLLLPTLTTSRSTRA